MSVSSEASCPSDTSTTILDDSLYETPSKKMRPDDQIQRQAAKNVRHFVNCRISKSVV